MSRTTVTCPVCSIVVKSSTPLPAGKAIRCPKCTADFTVPAESPDTDGFEVVDEAEKAPRLVSSFACPACAAPLKLLQPKPVGSKVVCPKCTANFTVPQPAATEPADEVPCELADDGAGGTGVTTDPAPLFKPFGSFASTPQEPMTMAPAPATPKPALGSNNDKDLPLASGKPKPKRLEKKKAEGSNLVLIIAGGTVVAGIVVVAGLLVFLLGGQRDRGAVVAQTRPVEGAKPEAPGPEFQAAIGPETKPDPEPSSPPPPLQPLPLPQPEMVAMPMGDVKPLPEKQAPPDAAAQQKADAEIKRLYKADYARKKPNEVLVLADKLMLKAGMVGEDPASKFVLYREACDLAALAGDAALAFKAIDALDREFKVEALDMKLGVLELVNKSLGVLTPSKALCDLAMGLVDDALGRESFDTATRLLKVAEAAAIRNKTPARVGLVQARMKEVEACRKDHSDAMAAAEKLAKSPDDPEANLLVGKRLCFVQGNWDKGLMMLSIGSDSKLKEMAVKDLSGLKEPSAQAALGDDWWDYGENQRTAPKKQIRYRAVYWYQQAIPYLAGLTLNRVEQRVQQMGDDVPVPVGEIRRFAGHGGGFAPEGRRMVYGGRDGVLHLCDVVTGKESVRYEGHTAEIVSVCFASDGRRFASSGTDKFVRLWDAESGKELRRLDPGTRGSYRLALSSDGRRLFTGDPDRKVHFWDLASTTQLGQFSTPALLPKRVAWILGFSPDGRFVISGGTDQHWRLWDCSSGLEIRRGDAQCLVYSGAISADGRLALIGGSDRNVWVWDLNSGKRIMCITGHTQTVRAVAFAPDGRRAISGSDDKTVRYWNVVTGKELYNFTGHGAPIEGLTFAPDGRRALSWAKDKDVCLIGLPKKTD
jgi:hypothetical protein